MTQSRRLFLFGALWSGLGLGFVGPLQAQTASKQVPTPSQVRVYLLRGLADIFSRGMDTLTNTLNRRGYQASVYSHTQWSSIAQNIAAGYARGDKPILVLIGHSLGANDSLSIANELDKRNIPVELLVTFDATNSYQVPKNVLHFVNFYQNNGVGKALSAAPGFQGEFSNVDLTTDTSLSITIDKSDRLHSYVLGKIGAIVEKDLAKRMAASKPKPKKPKKRG